MNEEIDYSPEVGWLMNSGILAPSEIIYSLPQPRDRQGDGVLVKQSSGDITTRIYHLRKRYFTGPGEPSTYLTATFDTDKHYLDKLVPFAWKSSDSVKLLFGLLQKGDHPEGDPYQPDYKYDIGTILNLGRPSEVVRFWYPVQPIPLNELTGVRLSLALFRSVRSTPRPPISPWSWEDFVAIHNSNLDSKQNLSSEAQVAILNAVDTFGPRPRSNPIGL